MHLIVGIDTGKTLAYACLNLDGELVTASHKASSGVEWLIKSISDIGVPSIVACDRTPNDVVRKVCTAFNAKLFYPKRELTIDEKTELSGRTNVKNAHERDACSAAIKAYNTYSNKLNQAAHIAKSHNAVVDEIRAKVIGRYSIDEAISKKAANRR